MSDKEDDYSSFIRRVLSTSAEQIFDNLKKDENLTPEDLEKRSKINDHKRGERAKQCIHAAEVIVIWGVSISVLILGFSFVWHIATPWSYLSDDQLDKAHTILSSAILASVLSSRFKRYFS